MDSAQPSPVAAAPQPPASPAAPVRSWPHSVRQALFVIVVSGMVGLVTRSLLQGSVQRPVANLGEPPLTRIDLNQATRAELQLLPGVGEQLAQRIEAYRVLYGPYQSIDELRNVPGIGPLTIERLRPWLIVSGPLRVAAKDADAEAARRLAPKASLPKPAAKETDRTAPINVNTATLEELQELPGIGPKLSQRIVETRTKEMFKSVDELRRVPGIGPKILAKIKPHVTIGAADVASK